MPVFDDGAARAAEGAGFREWEWLEGERSRSAAVARQDRVIKRVLLGVALACAVGLLVLPAFAHDIYSGVGDDHGTTNCCDSRDCEPAEFRMRPDGAEFYSARFGRWVFVPTGKITFRALKGSRHGAHWCGYQDTAEGTGAIGTRCAFIEPGGA